MQKSKLPNINPHKSGSQGNAAYLNSYKKYKKNFKHGSKKKIDESTKVQNSVSFSIQNRPMKMHSLQEKNIKP